MKIFLSLIFICFLLEGFAQADSTITDTTKKAESQKTLAIGEVVDKDSRASLLNAIVIKKGWGGKFLNPDGSFQIYLEQGDTLVISCMGYLPYEFYADSIKSDTTFLGTIKMDKAFNELAQHTVFPKRKISEIHDDLEKTRLELPDRPTGIDALQSPLTALYMRFSKMEKSKAIVARMEYEDRKNALLKELFRVYVDAEIINLSPDEFENFIDFANVSDHFLRTASEYELISFFQLRYQEYVALKRK